MKTPTKLLALLALATLGFTATARATALPPPPAPGATPYTDAHLSRVAFSLGGLGAGMICLEGTGALSHFSLRHRPDTQSQRRHLLIDDVKIAAGPDGYALVDPAAGPPPAGPAAPPSLAI